MAKVRANEQEPRVGEKTPPQSGNSDVAGMVSNVPSYRTAPAGTVDTYRWMRKNPTVAIGRMAVQAPVKSANWSIEADDEAPADAAEFIENVIVPMKPLIVREALRSLDYGFQPFELVWGETDGRLVPDKFKPLLPEITMVRVNRETGQYAGLKNQRVDLPPQNTFHVVHDGEGGNFYGRSLLENIRENAWWPWMELLRREGQFTSKVAGVTVAMHYVPGTSTDATGAEIDNSTLAKRALQSFGHGEGVLMPKQLAPFAEQIISHQSVDISKLLQWDVEFMEPQPGHGEAFVNQMRHKESLMLRGLMTPERAVTEGQYGTKAESESQAEILLFFASEVLQELARLLNKYVVDRMLMYNWGEQYRGTVRIVPEELIDEKAALTRKIVSEIFASPQSADLWMTITDVAAQLEQLGIPKAERLDEMESSGGSMEAEARAEIERAGVGNNGDRG